MLDTNSELKGAWDTFLTVVNSFGILVIIIIAFSEILRLNINTYGFKKMLPSLVMAILAANFSYMLVQVMVDTSKMAITFFMGGGNSLSQFQALTGGMFEAKWNSNDWLNPGVINPIMGIAFLVAIGMLTFLFVVRYFMIMFLIMVSPLAFMAMILPQTKSLFNQWFSTTAKWVYAPVISFAFLWAGALMFKLFPGTDLINFVFKMIVACAAGYFAATSPFKLGGAMTAWSNLGKKAWGATGGRAVGAIGAGLKARNEYNKNLNAAKFAEWGARMPWGKKKMEIEAQKRFNLQQPQDVVAKAKENADKKVYHGAYNGHLNGGKTLRPEALSRVRAKLRNWITEETKTHNDTTSSELYADLGNMGMLETTGPNRGRLKSEEDLAKLGSTTYIEGKARIRALLNQSKRSVTAGAADAELTKLFVDPARASKNDIAGDLLAAPAVGTPAGGTPPPPGGGHSSTPPVILGPPSPGTPPVTGSSSNPTVLPVPNATAGAGAQPSVHTATPVGNSTNNPFVVPAPKPGEKTASDFYDEEMNKASKDLQGMMAHNITANKIGGFKPMAFQAMAEAKLILDKPEADRTAAETARVSQVAKQHMGMSEFGKDPAKASEDEKSMSDLIGKLENGAKAFQSRGGGPKLGEGLGDYLTKKGDTDTLKEMDDVLKSTKSRYVFTQYMNQPKVPPQVMNAPVTQATSLNAPAQKVTGDDGVEHLERPIEEITRAVNKVGEEIARQQGVTHQNFTPAETRAGIINTASTIGASAGSRVSESSSLSDLFKDPAFQKRFADNIGKAVNARATKQAAPEIKVVQSINNTNNVNTTNVASSNNQTHINSASPAPTPTFHQPPPGPKAPPD
jgi:hypothetical protein